MTEHNCKSKDKTKNNDVDDYGKKYENNSQHMKILYIGTLILSFVIKKKNFVFS